MASGVVADLDAEIGVIVGWFAIRGATKGCGRIDEDAADLGGGHAEVDVGDALTGFD